MAKYDVTFACGHTTIVNLYGPMSKRERKIEWLGSQLCHACEKKMRLETISNWEKEMDLPDLIGSPKQIAWARDVRYSTLSQIEEEFDEDQCEKILDSFSPQSSVRFWIDNESELGHLSWKKIQELIKSLENEPLREEARQAAIIRPENVTHDGYVELSVSGKQIRVIYAEKSDALIKTLKQFGFTWNYEDRVWHRQIFPFASVSDQIAEIGNSLLHIGFSCCILDDDAREKAISGEYEETGKRLLWSKDSKDFSFQLLDRNEREDFIKKLYKIGGHCSYGNVIVSGTMYRSVGDFAKKYGFKLSQGAKRLMKQQMNREVEVAVGDHLDVDKIKKIEEHLVTSNNPLADLIEGQQPHD